VIGTGKIGTIFARIMTGFGCAVVGHDRSPSPAFEALGGRYVASTNCWIAATSSRCTAR
jgi:D-lactate dehydrogenase